jgi:hypothetical protein
MLVELALKEFRSDGAHGPACSASQGFEARV